jgi:vacuolar protein sorting-associated protein 45
MQQFASEHRVNSSLSSIADMRSFMDKYPAFRAQTSRVSKHVTITSELSRLVEVRFAGLLLWRRLARS